MADAHGSRFSGVVAFAIALSAACGDSAPRSQSMAAGAGGLVAAAAGAGREAASGHAADGGGASGQSHAGNSGRAGVGGGAGSVAGQAGARGAAGQGGQSGGSAPAAGSGGEHADGMPVLVGVGAWGLRARSTDAATWTYCGDAGSGDEHAPNLLRHIAIGAGTFIAVGGDQNSMVMRSLDGAHWQEDLHPTTSCAGEGYPSSCGNWMGAVAYLDGVWLAGGGNGALMRSSDDGLTWTGVHGGFPEKHIRALAAGSGRFLAGTDGGGLYVSTDRGESWTAKSVWMGAGSSAFLQLAHAHGTFVAFAGTDGACYVSSDSGDTWTACAAPVKASASFAFDETHLQWVAPVSGGYATSADAKTWVAHTASNVPRELAFDSARGHWFGRSGGTWYRGDTLDMFTRTAMNVSDYRAWALGDIPLTGIAMSGELCEDKR